MRKGYKHIPRQPIKLKMLKLKDSKNQTHSTLVPSQHKEKKSPHKVKIKKHELSESQEDNSINLFSPDMTITTSFHIQPPQPI